METSIITIATAALGLIQNVLPLVTNSAAVGNIVTGLEAIVPVIIQEGMDLYQPVKNIIAALTTNDAATDDQRAQLADLDAKADKAFDDAKAAYDAAHPAG